MEGVGKQHIDPLKLEKLREFADLRFPERPASGFRFVGLFAGIGGRCVFTYEWDRFCKQTYTAHFPEAADSDHKLVGNMRPHSENPAPVPDHDILLAGFPCQPLSTAGVSKKNALGRPHGFLCQTQGTLFYNPAKILVHHPP